MGNVTPVIMEAELFAVEVQQRYSRSTLDQNVPGPVQLDFHRLEALVRRGAEAAKCDLYDAAQVAVLIHHLYRLSRDLSRTVDDSVALQQARPEGGEVTLAWTNYLRDEATRRSVTMENVTNSLVVVLAANPALLPFARDVLDLEPYWTVWSGSHDRDA